jgi:hypothetical protein
MIGGNGSKQGTKRDPICPCSAVSTPRCRHVQSQSSLTPEIQSFLKKAEDLRASRV